MKRPARFLLFLAMALPAAAGAIEVKNTAGQVMEVEVLGYHKSSGNLRIKRSGDGRIFNTKIDLFDEASRKEIEAAAPELTPELGVEVSIGKRRARQGDSSFMKTQEITTTLKITNRTQNIDLARSKFTILLLGRSTSRYRDRNADMGKVLAKETFEQGIPAGRQIELECKPVKTSFDSDFDSTNVGGWEYDGYVLVIQNAAGKIVDARSNIGPVETVTLKSPEAILKALNLEVEAVVDRTLRPAGGAAR